ncbi:MAG: hypothetical protein ABI360_04225 [Allobranchiibius sp.]
MNFYGQMDDDLNGLDEADRLAATWVLDSPQTVAAAEGTAADPTGPATDAEILTAGPDQESMVLRDGAGLWIAVPRDIVELRVREPDQARAWRLATREAFLSAFGDGLVATHVTRQGYYLLTPGGRQ